MIVPRDLLLTAFLAIRAVFRLRRLALVNRIPCCGYRRQIRQVYDYGVEGEFRQVIERNKRKSASIR